MVSVYISENLGNLEDTTKPVLVNDSCTEKLKLRWRTNKFYYTFNMSWNVYFISWILFIKQPDDLLKKQIFRELALFLFL